MKVFGFTICKYIQFASLEWKLVIEISLNLIGFTDFFYKVILTSLISFSSRNTFSLNLSLKSERCLGCKIITSFNDFFFVTNRIGSETSHKLPN